MPRLWQGDDSLRIVEEDMHGLLFGRKLSSRSLDGLQISQVKLQEVSLLAGLSL
jgi:hypothetical protein